MTTTIHTSDRFRREDRDRPPREARQTIDPQTRFRYFATLGFLLYDRNDGYQHTLLDRQVIPFCRPSEGVIITDLCFMRFHILMGAASEQLGAARVVQDDAIKVPGKEIPHRESYLALDYAKSTAGFTGRHFSSDDVTQQMLDFIQPGANLDNFLPEHDVEIQRVFPSFFVRVDMDALMSETTEAAEALAESFDLLEMFDVNTMEWGWFKRLDQCGPFALGTPEKIEEHAMTDMEMKLIREFGFRDIHVGMASIGPTQWKPASSTLNGLRPRAIDREHPFVAVMTNEFPLSRLPHLFTSQEFVDQNAISLNVFHIPRPMTDSAFRRQYMDRVLNGPARQSMRRLLQRSATPDDQQNVLGQLPGVH